MRKWRFSLRSLVMLVLTLAAGATLWKNAPPWRVEHAFTGFEEPCDSILLSPDAKWILAEIKRRGEAGKPDYTICKLWNVESGSFNALAPVVHRRVDENEPGNDDAYLSTAFSPDSRFALTGFSSSRAYQFKLWDLQKGSEVVLDPPQFTTNYAMFSPDGRYLLRDSNQAVQLFDLHTTNRVLEQNHFTHGRFSSDGSLLAITYDDGSASVFETSNATLLHRIDKQDGVHLTRIGYLSREQLFVYAARPELYDPGSRRHLPASRINGFTAVFDLKNPQTLLRRVGGNFVSASPDGTKGIVADSGFEFLEMDSLQRYGAIEAKLFQERWSPDGTLVFNAMDSSLYETSSGCHLFEGDDYGETVAGFSRFVSQFGVSSYEKRGITIHDMRDGRLLQAIPGECVFTFEAFPKEHFVTQNTKSHAINYWSRYRPEEWWGLAWLPEFWLFLVLAGALVWSLRRDWNNT